MDEDLELTGDAPDESGMDSVGADLNNLAQSYDVAGLTSAYERVGASAAGARKALQAARERIMARKYNDAIPLLAMSAALGAPTRAGSTAESFAAMNQALIDPLRDKAAFEQQREKELFGVDTGLAGIDERLSQSALTLEGLKAKLAAQSANAPLEKVIVPGKKHPIGMTRAQARGRELWTPPGSTTNVNLNTAKKFEETFAEQQAKQYSELYKAAQDAPEGISRARQIKELLKSPAYTGATAEFRLAIGKGLRALGVNFAKDDIQNTEALIVNMSRGVLDMVKSSGLAGSQGLTEGERKFLERAVSGQATLERATIERIADINDRIAQNTIKRWNDTYARLNNPRLMGTLGLEKIEQPRGQMEIIELEKMPNAPSGGERTPEVFNLEELPGGQ